MRQYQKGEAMLVMMIVMLAVIWLGSGRMGMMGHGAAQTEKPGNAEQQMKKEQPPPAPEGSR